VLDLHGERARHVLDGDGGPGRRARAGQRVTHHAVGAAVHDMGHAARLTGAVERHRHARGADQGLYFVQAGHGLGVLRLIFERTLMATEM
jgi:hypothetical protein